MSTLTTPVRRRLAAAALSVPLALSLVGTALAAGPAGPQRPAGVGQERADAPTTEPTTAPTAQALATDKGKAEKADKATGPDHSRGNAGTSGVATEAQPASQADAGGSGANSGDPCEGPYCSTRDGSASGNGKGDGAATGKPCAGCVGKADNKNPKGQLPGGSDHNAGYECDRNQGVGQTNPAHTGCTEPSTTPTTAPTKPADKPADKPTDKPTDKPVDKPGNGTAVITVDATCTGAVVTSSKDISNVVVRFVDGTSVKFDGLTGTRWTAPALGKPIASVTAKSATSTVTDTTGCGATGGTTDACAGIPGDQPAGTDCTPKTPDVCLDMPGDQPVGTVCLGGGDGGPGKAPVDVCPLVPGMQDDAAACLGTPPVDACPEVPGMQGSATDCPAVPASGPCPATKVFGPVARSCNPTLGGGSAAPGLPGVPGSPIFGQPQAPGSAAPGVVANGSTPRQVALPTGGSAVLGRAVPSALPFTGTDGLLLLAVGAALVLGGGGLTAAARSGARTAA